ncbi:MAG: hypothetical protein SGPRY_001241 [Prymnesium sp.]
MSTLRAAGSSLLRAGEHLKRIRVGGVPEHFNTPWHTVRLPLKICPALLSRACMREKLESAVRRLKGSPHSVLKWLIDDVQSAAEAGLQIEWTTFPGGTGDMTKALREDKLDVAVVLTEGIVAEIIRGNPSKLLGTYVSTPLSKSWGVHVSASSKWSDTSELEHATYAVSRLGSGSHLMAMVDAQQRGWSAEALKFEIVGNLQGARSALAEGKADAFMWEKFTTKNLVDSGEWRRIGEALMNDSAALLTMLKVLEQEAQELTASVDVCETVAVMYGQQVEDVAEWIKGAS